jgi:chemotaxis signal transduction protein
VDSASFERPPENLDPAISELVRGIHKLKDRLLLVLDIGQTLSLDGGTGQPAR